MRSRFLMNNIKFNKLWIEQLHNSHPTSTTTSTWVEIRIIFFKSSTYQHPPPGLVVNSNYKIYFNFINKSYQTKLELNRSCYTWIFKWCNRGNFTIKKCWILNIDKPYMYENPILNGGGGTLVDIFFMLALTWVHGVFKSICKVSTHHQI